MENFRQPNFELVADILYWMTSRFDPEIPIHNFIETEDDRVKFLKSIAFGLDERAGLQLDLRKLYCADGYAVKELLKVGKLLKDAVDEADKFLTNNNNEDLEEFALPIKDAKEARCLANAITSSAVALHSMLERELEYSEDRTKILKLLEFRIEEVGNESQQSKIEQKLTDIVDTLREEVNILEYECKNLSIEELDLQENLSNKTIEYERCQKRMESLKTIRPSFMDEYDSLESDLQDLYDIYLEKHRNVHYLKGEIEKYEREEYKQSQETERMMRRVQKKIHKQELELLRGDVDVIQNSNDSNDSPETSGETSDNNTSQRDSSSEDSIIIDEKTKSNLSNLSDSNFDKSTVGNSTSDGSSNSFSMNADNEESIQLSEEQSIDEFQIGNESDDNF